MRPIQIIVEQKLTLKEPEVVAELRKIREAYASELIGKGYALRSFLISHAADPVLMQRLNGVREGRALIKILGDFVLQNSQELVDHMRLLARRLKDSMAQLFQARGPAHEPEVMAWYTQEHDRLQEHLEEIQVKQERVCVAIKKCAEEGFGHPQAFEMMLTPELVEQLVGYCMAQLQAEIAMGITK